MVITDRNLLSQIYKPHIFLDTMVRWLLLLCKDEIVHLIVTITCGNTATILCNNVCYL